MLYFLLSLLIFVIAVTLTSGDQHDNKVDIGATVQEVENMLAKDPRLPRLTRGEILKLIDEVRTGKDVVVVLPDNASTDSYGSSTTAKPKRPVKRRRKKPTTVRPVYVHATTAEEPASSASSIATSSEVSSSSTESNDWIPSSTSRPKIKLTSKPSAAKPQSESPGVLPPIPGLDVVEGINSWTGTGGNKQAEPSIYITPTPPASADSPLESPPNVRVAAESLGPEMKDLLTKFGLLGEATTEKFYQGAYPAPTIDPEVYSRFKPLPVKSSAEAVSPDMKSFLASFGLLDSRQGKGMMNKQETNSPLEYIPDYHKNILTQLGLFKNGKAIDLSGLDAKRETPQHVFNPNKVENGDRKAEFEKVSKILTKLREIGEGDESKLSELSPSDVEELLSLEKNTNLLQQVLHVHHFRADLFSRLSAQGQVSLEDESKGFEGEKNDVKRAPQESSASASASASSNGFGSISASVSASASAGSGTSASSSAESDSTANESTSPSSLEELPTTSEAPSSDSGDTTERGASAVDLEASFGNGDTSTKRPNGFYFLLDWNSFLDVGLDDRAIHLNFSPKVGDPKNFLPVVIGNSQSSR